MRGTTGARAGVAAGTVLIALAGCGSSGGGGSSSSSSPGGGEGNSKAVATAKAAVAQYTGKPSEFPVDQPLKAKPTGKTFAFLQCSTPVCGLFAQLLPPTEKLLGYKLTITKAGASASQLQTAMSTIASQKPSGVLLGASDPKQYSSQLKQLIDAKTPVSTNGVMNPTNYGIQASNFDQRLSMNAGKLLADWVISRNGTKADAVFYTVPELDFSNYIEQGFDQEMGKLCPSCKTRTVKIPVATVGNSAPSTVVNDLQSHPDTKTVVFGSAETATGLPAALKSSGLKVQTVGFAPNPAILQYIKDGQFDAGLGLDLAIMVWTQVDELARLNAGQPLTDGEKAGTVPIQFLYKKDLPGDVSKGWTGYPDFPKRFAQIWAGK